MKDRNPVDRAHEKEGAAEAAAALVRDGMVVGLGTGSTADLFLNRLANRVRDGLRILGVPTSNRTRALAERLGIPLCAADAVPETDLTIDGADEIDPELRLIKGAGGALLQEKIVAAASRAMVVIADSSKCVGQLGTAALPVEVVPFGWDRTAAAIQTGCAGFGERPPEIRRRNTADGTFRTDSGHFILDCSFESIRDPLALAGFLDRQPGVVEHGLFIGVASAALVGRGGSVDIIGQLP